MKKQLLTLALTLAGFYSWAQPEVEYAYDAAGNRILRSMIIVGGMAQNSNGSETQPQSLTEHLAEDGGDITVNLYPNPTQAHVDITINYQDVPQQVVMMSLHDVNGKLLESQKVAESRHQIDMQRYTPGIYYLRIATLENKTMKEIKILRK